MPDSNNLPLLKSYQQGRILGAKLAVYEDLHIPAFDYANSIESIYSQLPKWPDSTKGITQARLGVRYKVHNSILKKIQAHSQLDIDIVDYPGEWLIDLPMMNLSFKDWSLSINPILLGACFSASSAITFFNSGSFIFTHAGFSIVCVML